MVQSCPELMLLTEGILVRKENPSKGPHPAPGSIFFEFPSIFLTFSYSNVLAALLPAFTTMKNHHKNAHQW